MKAKPILFSTPMVQAILEGRKTQTRRIVKPQPEAEKFSAIIGGYDNIPRMARFWTKRDVNNPFIEDIKSKYRKDDILWVRETFQHTKCLHLHPSDDYYGYIYKADGEPWEDYENWKWKPSIFMPKEAARIFLKVNNIRVERLQDISENDSLKEGVIIFDKYTNEAKKLNLNGIFKDYLSKTFPDSFKTSAKESFETLWQSINGNWEENPFVWVYEFEQVEKPENFI